MLERDNELKLNLKKLFDRQEKAVRQVMGI